MENNLDDLIDDYFANQLEPDRRRDFERQVAADPDLAARVDFEQSLYTSLDANSPENQLRANLQRISGKFDHPDTISTEKKGLKIWPWLVLGIVLVAVLFFWNNKHPETPAATMPAPQNQSLPQPSPTQPDVEPTMPPENKNSGAVAKPQPIAAAFKPLAQLDAYIGSQVRSGDFRFRVTEPKSGATLVLLSGHADFRLAGNVEGVAPVGSTFNVLIFNNKLSDFEALRPMATLALKPDNNGYFLLKRTLNLPAGLYYFLIEENPSGQWIIANKFIIR